MRLAGGKVREVIYVIFPPTNLLLEKFRDIVWGTQWGTKIGSTFHSDVERTTCKQTASLIIILLFNNEPQFGYINMVRAKRTQLLPPFQQTTKGLPSCSIISKPCLSG